MKKLTALLLAIAMMVTCTLCAVAEDGKTYMAVCIASEPDTLDPALNSAVDGATMVAHLFAGLSTWAQTDDGKLEIVPDCAVELPDPVVNDDGTVTYTYTLVDGLKWSDGKDLTAKDFEFAWKRAASSELGADYGYMFEVIKGYTTDGSDPKAENLAVTAVDEKTLTYLYNTSEAHKAIGEYLQSAVSAVGITMNLTNQEWNTFLNTRKSGDYSIARNGWIADYNDPICFLDMWVTGSGNNDVQFGKGANADLKIYNLDLTPYGYDVKVENGTWAETYDVLISTIKSCTNSTNRYAMMHIAEDMLMNTGCIVPLYYYTDIYMIDDSVQGFFSNPLGYKYFMHCTIAK